MPLDLVKRSIDENERLLKAAYGDPVTDTHARALINIGQALVEIARDMAALSAQVAKVIQAQRR